MAYSLFGWTIDLNGLFQAVKGFLGPFGKLIDSFKEVYNHVTNIVGAATTLKDSILEEIDGWKNFKQDIRLKQRVIQLESAIKKTRDLIQGIPDAWHSILDLIKQIKSQITEGNPVEEAEAAVEDVEAGGLKTLLTKFPALAKALERLLGVLAIVIQALTAIANAIDDIQTVVDELKRLRLEIEKLDTIFLSQSNKRKRLKLEDGSTIRIRLGKLHQTV